MTGKSPVQRRKGPGFFRRLVRRFTRIVLWSIVAIVLWALATGITLLLGAGVYAAKGRPGSYADRQVMNEFVRAIYIGPTMVSGQTVSFAGLRAGTNEKDVISQARDWKSPRPAEVVHEQSGLGGVYQTDDDGNVTRIYLIRRNLPNDAQTRLMGRVRGTWRTPSASVTSSNTGSQINDVFIWRSSRHIMIIEAKPVDRLHFDLFVTIMTSHDPMYKALWDTGGLSPVHRHAKKIRESLAK
ncbi:hypothetical protein KQI84_13400 [bacterium]|nr:hypothetical protein [bacterium]